jgi:N utilization substance protein B
MTETKVRNPLAGRRRKAREFALLGVYQSLIDEDADYAKIDANLLSVLSDEDEPLPAELSAEDFDHCDQDLYKSILSGVMDEKAELAGLVGAHVDRPLERLSTIEHACLLIGAWELKHSLDTPYRVVINEAVELTKTFGSDKGFKLVNGVLDKVALDVRPDEVRAG